MKSDKAAVGAIKKAWHKLGFVVYIKSGVKVELLLLHYRMGQAATLPCRRGESYVTELYQWFR